MEVFWRKGYDATTLPDLLEAMGGISPPSFYAAFGSKEQVFVDAVGLYQEKVAAPTRDAILGGATARDAFRAFLYAGIDSFAGSDTPPGCLVALGGVNCGSPTVAELLARMRRDGMRLLQQRLRRGIADGDVPRTADLVGIVRYYVATTYGLALSARDGTSRAALRRVADVAIAAWDHVAAPHPTRRVRRNL
jgi:AcrR family transcriptional regulator